MAPQQFWDQDKREALSNPGLGDRSYGLKEERLRKQGSRFRSRESQRQNELQCAKHNRIATHHTYIGVSCSQGFWCLKRLAQWQKEAMRKVKGWQHVGSRC